MLKSLSIHNIVLVDQLELDFMEAESANGDLITLTGETGAGKSIILDSLSLALGMRAETRLIRKNQDKAQVGAVFHLPASHPLYSYLAEQDFMIEKGEEIIIRRSLSSDGRSKAYLNDQPVSVTLLKDVGEYLVEIHGQFETHGLLNVQTHRALLDAYANHNELVDSVSAAWHNWQSAKRNLEDIQARAADLQAEEEYLKASLEELDKLSPIEEGEEDALLTSREAVKNKVQIAEGLNEALAAIADEQGAQPQMVRAQKAIERIADKIGVRADEMINNLDQAFEAVNAVYASIENACQEMESEDRDIESIEDRLYALRGASRKYSAHINELESVRENFSKQLSEIENIEETLQEYIKNVQDSYDMYVKAAGLLGKSRRTAASKLDKLVNAELPPLKLEKAQFCTSLTELTEGEWGAYGTDQIRFEVATNPGSAPGPLNKVASGGELARFMLALKVVMAGSGTVDTMIFDEVDSGVGGATAAAIGERLAALAKQKQVLVVTHSPQIAAQASQHFVVSKSANDDATSTSVTPLTSINLRQEEIARMLSGENITKEARAAASQLMKRA